MNGSFIFFSSTISTLILDFPDYLHNGHTSVIPSFQVIHPSDETFSIDELFVFAYESLTVNVHSPKVQPPGRLLLTIQLYRQQPVLRNTK